MTRTFPGLAAIAATIGLYGFSSTMVIRTREEEYRPRPVFSRYGFLGTGGLDSQPCPAQFFARSPAQRAKRRARNGRK